VVARAHLHFVVNSKKSLVSFILISVRAEKPCSQSHEDANGKIIVMALTPIIE